MKILRFPEGSECAGSPPILAGYPAIVSGSPGEALGPGVLDSVHIRGGVFFHD
jgi:hypothetical protein